MKLSKIKSSATYHKCIRELVSFGYIAYTPSYDPIKGSQLSLKDALTKSDLELNSSDGV